MLWLASATLSANSPENDYDRDYCNSHGHSSRLEIQALATRVDM